MKAILALFLLAVPCAAWADANTDAMLAIMRSDKIPPAEKKRLIDEIANRAHQDYLDAEADAHEAQSLYLQQQSLEEQRRQNELHEFEMRDRNLFVPPTTR